MLKRPALLGKNISRADQKSKTQLASLKHGKPFERPCIPASRLVKSGLLRLRIMEAEDPISLVIERGVFVRNSFILLRKHYSVRSLNIGSAVPYAL